VKGPKRRPTRRGPSVAEVVSDGWMAPVRACLAGEDLDWLGGRCCCVALDLPTVVSRTTGRPADPRYVGAVWRAVARNRGLGGDDPPPLMVTAAAPPGSGLSTSSSLIIALVRACSELIGLPEPTPEELVETSYEIEYEMDHGGGMDQTTIVHGGALLMDGRRDGVPHIAGSMDWPAAIGLAVIASGQPKDNLAHLRDVRRRLAADDPRLERYMLDADVAARRVWDALAAADVCAVAAAVNDAHASMRDKQGMSTPLLETLRDLALEAGFHGAKITGAGGGGALIAVGRADELEGLVLDLLDMGAARRLGAMILAAAPMRSGWYPGNGGLVDPERRAL
jgi:mevalonate kinase